MLSIMEVISGMKDDKKSLRQEVLEHMRTLIAAGFGFVAALAWNEAAQALLKALLPRPGSTLVGKFIYAVLATVVFAIVTARIKKDEDTQLKIEANP